MTKDQIGIALELVNGHGWSYEKVSYLCSCLPSTLKRLDRDYMTFKKKGHVVTIQSKINKMSDNYDYHSI